MFTSTARFMKSARRSLRIHRHAHYRAHAFEALETRTLFAATLFVTSPAVPTDDTHYQTLQSALAMAVAGDTVVLQAGFDAGTFANSTLAASAFAGTNFIQTTDAFDVGEVIAIGNGGSDPVEYGLVVGYTLSPGGTYFTLLANNLSFNHSGSAVSAANSPTIGINQGITLTAEPGVTLPFNLEIWKNTANVALSHLDLGSNGLFIDGGANNNSVSDSTFAQVQLRTGSHDNTITHNAIGNLTALGAGNTSGHDAINQNTFTGQVVITGNSTADTGDAISSNTFTASSGDALTLHHANGSLLQNNTFTNSGAGAASLVVHNSDNIIVTGNTFAPTGTGAIGLSIYADGTGSASVEVTGNAIHTTTGTAVKIAKNSATAALEVRLQSNSLTTNAIGVAIFGDGTAAGNVDLGGDTLTPTRFDASIGDNDFTTFTTANATHFAVGLFNTAPAATVFAWGNHFTPTDPGVLVVDGTHTPAAAGTGVISLPPVATPDEVIDGSVNDLAAIQTGSTTGVVASFTSTFDRTAADFTVSIDWGDGTSSNGLVIANDTGGFDVVATHQWNTAGQFAFTVAIDTVDASASMQGDATVTPRLLTAAGKDFQTVKKTLFNGAVATFTDNLPGTTAACYQSSVTWSDGVTTVGVITKNAGGSFCISTTRSFKGAGAFIASVSVSTLNGLFSATTTTNGTVTNPSGKDGGHILALNRLYRKLIHYVKVHPTPAPAHGGCKK